jgi:carboxyl-terminal processing protease
MSEARSFKVNYSRHGTALIITLLVVVFGCQDDAPSPAIAYLNNLVDVMEANSINRKTIDWPEFRKEVIAAAGNAHSIGETSAAIGVALTRLGDNHSFVKTASGQYITRSTLKCTDSPISPVSPPDNIGYVRISGFLGDGTESRTFAQTIQDQIKAKDKPDLIGWIVDLRGNRGGNMWPMLAGIGPILGTETCGYFIDPDNNTVSWAYFADGSSRYDGYVAVSIATPPYSLFSPPGKVAVLTDNLTSSSGEAIAIAFIGKANTRSFGKSTCGLSTATSPFNLSDGSQLYLTVSFMADRFQNKFGYAVVPDESTATNLDAFQAAIDWINQ